MKIDLTCPVELWHYALPTRQYPVCHLQLFNLTEQTVTSLQVVFACYDAQGALMSRQVERIQAQQGLGRSAFEVTAAIDGGEQAEGLDFSIEKVWFEDGTVWRHTAGNVSEYTSNALPAGRRLDVLRYLAGADALGYPSDQGAVWMCVCGRPNSAREDTCRRCGRLQRDVDGGVFVGNCYVVAGAFEMPHVYDGVHLPGAEPPACEQQGIRHISEQEVRAMAGQEGLVLQGCGGDLKEWVDGINGLLTESGILRNGTVFTEAYAFSHDGLTNLLFPFEDGVDIDVGRLAVWRLATHEQFGGTWLSDYIPNRLEDSEADESQDICQQCEM